MKKEWSDEAWDDYLYWQTQDKKTLKKINELIKDIDRNGVYGLGKSEPLRYRPGWSRRIDKENRLIFDIKDDTHRVEDITKINIVKELIFYNKSLRLCEK